MTGLWFDDLWPVAEWSEGDEVGWLDGQDRYEDVPFEFDRTELGLRVAECLADENGFPEYRRWEREDVIRHRVAR